jgi:peptide-methionine (R)-S-oxide reductase
VKPILTRFGVFLATSALVVGSAVLRARGQDSADSSGQQVPGGSPAADGGKDNAKNRAGSDSTGKDAAGTVAAGKRDPKVKSRAKPEPEFIRKTDAEWRRILTKTQYMVTRQRATEPAYSGAYATGHFRGTFHCVCCDAELFGAESKFESGTGWPSFDRPANARAVARAMDYDAFEPRIEVMCRRCGAHLGHVFDDGPTITGLRFCINSVAIKLKPPDGESTSTKPSTRTAPRSRGKARAKSRAKTKTNTKAKAKTKQPPQDSQESSRSAQDEHPAGKATAPAAKPSE